jgi:hypothetical protein
LRSDVDRDVSTFNGNLVQIDVGQTFFKGPTNKKSSHFLTALSILMKPLLTHRFLFIAALIDADLSDTVWWSWA